MVSAILVLNSPASRAGIQREDVIIQWDGKKVSSPRRLSFLVATTGPETTVEAVIIRGGQKQTIAVKVGRLPTRLVR